MLFIYSSVLCLSFRPMRSANASPSRGVEGRGSRSFWSRLCLGLGFGGSFFKAHPEPIWITLLLHPSRLLGNLFLAGLRLLRGFRAGSLRARGGGLDGRCLFTRAAGPFIFCPLRKCVVTVKEAVAATSGQPGQRAASWTLTLFSLYFFLKNDFSGIVIS